MENEKKQIEDELRKSVAKLKKMRKEGHDSEMLEIIRDLVEEKGDATQDKAARAKHQPSQTL